MWIYTLLVMGLAATIVLVAVTYSRRSSVRDIYRRGFINACVAGLVVAAVTALLVTLFLNGKDFFGTISLSSAFGAGLIVGAAVGLGFFWLNMVILSIGMWFKPANSWPLGEAFATPVVIAAVGFGAIAFNTYQYQQAQPRAVPGTAQIVIDGQTLGHASAAGSANCQLLVDGGLSLDATITADDGRQVDIQLGIPSSGDSPNMAIVVGNVQAFPGKGWDPASTTHLAPVWNRASGQLTFDGLVPLDVNAEPDPTERWSGNLSWTCPGG